MKKCLCRLTVSLLSLLLFPLQSALLVDESFSDLSGWTDNTSGNWSVGSNLTYSGWASSGNGAAELTTGTGDNLANTTILGSNTLDEGTTYWGGVLIQNAAASTAIRQYGFYETSFNALRLVVQTDGSNNILLGTRDGAGDPGSGNLSTGSAVAIGTGSTNLLLFRIDVQAGNDNLYAWWNPDLGSGAPSTGSATWSSVGLDNFATTANMAGFRFASSNSQQVTFDELRLGDSFNAVIPEPSTFALVGLTGLALVFGLRRRY